MTGSFLDRVRAGETLLSDGGMGTSLQAALGHFDCAERLNFDEPDVVASAHAAFYEAGSDFVETNTFGGTRALLQRHGLGDRVEEVSERAAQIARSVCPDGCFVVGSVGPSGEMLEPFGDAQPDELFRMFEEQCRGLVAGGVDAVVVETMMAAEEAELAVRAAKATGLPVVATMTFTLGPGGVRTRWGVEPETAVRVLEGAGADVIGSNCGDGFDEMFEVISAMKAFANRPLIAQANAGVPEMVEGELVYHETPEVTADKAGRLLDLGLAILGGCCGTTPAHVEVMRQRIDETA